MRIVAAFSIAALLLAGCSSAGEAQPGPTVTVEVPGPTVTVTETAEAEPAPTESKVEATPTKTKAAGLVIGPGMYIVGDDIPPGTYKGTEDVPPGSYCLIQAERSDEDGGGWPVSVVVEEGPVVVRIPDEDLVLDLPPDCPSLRLVD